MQSVSPWIGVDSAHRHVHRHRNLLLFVSWLFNVLDTGKVHLRDASALTVKEVADKTVLAIRSIPTSQFQHLSHNARLLAGW